MRKLFTVLVMALITSSLFGGSGIFQDYIILNINGGGNTFYAGGINADGAALYTAATLGTPGSLILSGGEVKTYKNGGDDIFGARIFYRVYKQGETPGSFTELNLPFESNLPSSGDQRWQLTTANVDLLALANSNGTWVLEVYWTAPYNFGTHTDDNTGSYYSNTFSVTTLPIELSSFTAKKQGNATQLNWATSTEENNDFFTIEKSLDGVNFKAIGTKAGAGNSLEAKEYSFIDENPANGVNYYRLKQTDFDGKFTYSEVVSVDFKISVQATIYPNPTSEKLTINTEIQDVVNIRIFNVNGQIVYQNTQRIDNQTDINLSELAAGNYFLIIANDATQATIYSSSFVKD